MKVLFAVNNETISESIIKKYQQEYKEIISSKNVYYFDAIVRELQKDKTYDRIVISEDVEPFTNNNYGVMDNFIFTRLDRISDEATTPTGQDIPIILICADRRAKSENILVKLFGIGIYSALLGQDRTISKVCELINKPRSKKDAKIYYKIESDEVDYKTESEGNVNEVEIQNILNHYKRLGKNEEEYVKSFDNIAEQYTDAQLRVICKFLPLNVKAVLEANSQKYQELITFGTVTPSSSQQKSRANKYVPNAHYYENKKKTGNDSTKKDILEKNIGTSEITKPVVIPTVSGVNKKEIKEENTKKNIEAKPAMPVTETKTEQKDLNQDEIENILQSLETNISAEKNDEQEVTKKRRGRPKKVVASEENEQNEEQGKKKRGRPRKVQTEDAQEENEQDNVDLFNLADDEKENDNGEIILPGLNENSVPDVEQKNNNDETIDLFGLDDGNEDNAQNYNMQSDTYTTHQNDAYNFNTTEVDTTEKYAQTQNSSFENLLGNSNKLVAFVGTSKNGTSFLVNSMAEILSRKGIKTAILDLTKNKNAYYIYTQNDEALRKTAFSCIENLRNGIDRGIEVNKSLTVFTTLPDNEANFHDYQNILTTLKQNYSLVIMDCDYETDYNYFNLANEIFLVQSYDILTIQPLTAFLRNLKARNILDQNKLRIVLNKVLRVRSITDRLIIGGISSYNDPAMSYMTELFDKDNIKYCTIPFDQDAYSKYLDGLVNCQISTRGYPKNILLSLEKLGNMMYPLLNNDKPANKLNAYTPRTSGFSSNMNETLNKMKNRY